MLFFCAAHCVIADTYHIVTTHSSPCPGEFIGEPCLTLQQYADSQSQDSNVSLVVESGSHRLQTNYATELATRVDHFTMIAGQGYKDAAHIVIYPPAPVYYRYMINYALTVHFSRIHFSCTTGSTCERIRIEDVQQLYIEDCTFQGVKLNLGGVTNAMILQTCFYNGSGLSAYSSTINITRCTFRNNMQAVYYFSRYNNAALTISESTFIDNYYSSAYRGGAAIYASVSRYSRMLIDTTTFVNNTAVTGEGGALYLIGDLDAATVTATVCHITRCAFVYNSANSSNCGAINAQDTNVNITNSSFYYNRANGDGGVACIRSANIDVSRSTFVQNVALGNGGAFHLDESNMYLNSTLFKSNRAGQDGGALATYVYPSTYAIIHSTFTDNHAGDDGGAVFIGCADSVLRVELSTLNNNHAIDRGGSITIYGSTVIMMATNVYDNTAGLGNSMCTCSSEVNISFSDGQRDATQPECTNYDTNMNFHDLALVQEKGYPDIIHLSTKNWETTCSLSTDNSLYDGLRKASATSYTALTISITLALAMLMYIIILRAFQYRMTRRSRATSVRVEPVGDDQVDPLHDEAHGYTSSTTDTRDIEMIPNVVYGKHTTS